MRNWAFFIGVSPGFSRLWPSESHSDQLVVLARSVDARERLFVQQANVAMPPGRAAHHFHRQHVVVRGDVHVLVYGSDLELAGSHFVVAGMRRDAEREKALLHTCI